VHYVSVDTAQDVPAMVRWLRANDEYARAVAAAGQARMSSLDVGAVTDFMAEMLSQYSRRLTFPIKGPQPGAVRIECEDDLWRHYSLSKSWMMMYLMHDNKTYVHPRLDCP
jgi:protein glucosyltransferase